MNPPIDPSLDLYLERTVSVAPELVWKAWTTPDQLMQWFTPKPWTTPEVEIDLRPGGAFRTVQEGPDGERQTGNACYLEIVENRKLVWTTAMAPGFRPHPAGHQEFCGPLVFTAIISMEPNGTGTKYSAHVMHPDAETKDLHEGMGLHDGWGTVFDQLIALVSPRE